MRQVTACLNRPLTGLGSPCNFVAHHSNGVIAPTTPLEWCATKLGLTRPPSFTDAHDADRRKSLAAFNRMVRQHHHKRAGLDRPLEERRTHRRLDAIVARLDGEREDD